MSRQPGGGEPAHSRPVLETEIRPISRIEIRPLSSNSPDNSDPGDTGMRDRPVTCKLDTSPEVSCLDPDSNDPDTAGNAHVRRIQADMIFPDNCPTAAQMLADATRLGRPELGDGPRKSNPALAKIYDVVRADGRPNYRGARVPVPSALNVNEWRAGLAGYDDQTLVDHLTYGFPLGYEGHIPPLNHRGNHPSAHRDSTKVDQYIAKEMQYGALIGPFEAPPFLGWNRVNPIMTRPKKEPGQIRVITDLSCPYGNSVNSATPSHTWDSVPYKLTLATAKSYADAIALRGPGTWMSKVDLRRAYKQLPIDPLDYPLTGIVWEGKWYFDTRAQFGGRWGAAACQRTTEALASICLTETETEVFPYIDDMATLNDEHENAVVGYDHLLGTMSQLGLEAAPEKCEPPAQVMTFAGVMFDSVRMRMCLHYLSQASITEHQLQSLVGKLYHVVSCPPGAERFINRLRQLLSPAGVHGRVLLAGAYLDLAWFAQFLPSFNGMDVIRDGRCDFEVAVDSCLTGAGGVSPNASYMLQYGPGIIGCGFSISGLEAYNLLVAVRLWVTGWRHKHVLIYVDNSATVATMESGRADDPLMQGVAREIWWHCATNGVRLTVRHRPESQMTDPDVLSRCHLSKKFADRVEAYVERTGNFPVVIPVKAQAPPMLI